MSFTSWLRKLSKSSPRKNARRGLGTRLARYKRFQPGLERLERRDVPVIFTVTSNAAFGPGTLHQAILNANATLGEDTIVFNLPAGMNVIMPVAANPLPIIAESLIIDGKTQSGYVPSTDTTEATQIVTLDGLVAGNNSGFTANAVGRLIVDGMLIQNFQVDGVTIRSSGQLVMTDDRLLSNRSDGVDANVITDGSVGVLLRGIVAQNQTQGAGLNLTGIARFEDRHSKYLNNGENGIRMEDVGTPGLPMLLVNILAINNNFDQVAGTGSGFVAFDGFDSDLHAINGDIEFQGCNFGTQPFGVEPFQRQVDGVRILGVQGSIKFTSYVNSLGQLQITQSNFNRGDGLHIESAQDVSTQNVSIDRGNFSNNGSVAANAGDGIDISLFGAAGGNVSLSQVTANSNGGSGFRALALPGTLQILSGSAAQVSHFDRNGQLFAGGDGITLTNVRSVVLQGGVPGVGVICDSNRDAGMEVTTAISVTDTDGQFTNNGNSGIRVVDISGDVLLTRSILRNNDFDANLAGSGLEGIDGMDGDAVAIGGSLTVLGGTFEALLTSANERQFRGISVDGVSLGVTLGASTTGLTRGMLVRNNSDDGVNISNALFVTFNGGVYSENGKTLVSGSGDGSGDGIDLDTIFGDVNFTSVTVNDNGNNGLEASNIGGTVTVFNSSTPPPGNTTALSTFDNNGLYIGPNDPQGGDGMNFIAVNGISLNPTNIPTGVSASNNHAALFGAIAGAGGRGIFINQAAAAFTDLIGNYSQNANGGLLMIDMNSNVTLTRTTANTNDFDADLVGDGLNATDQDGDGTGIRGNLTISGGTFSDAVAGPSTQQNGIFVIGIGGNAVFQNAGAQTMQANFNAQRGAFLSNGVNATFTNGSYSNNGLNGIAIFAFTNTVTLTNVTVNGNGTAAPADGFFGFGPITNLNITGGSFSGNSGSGIGGQDLINVNISGANASTNGFNGVILLTATGPVNLTNVIANGNGADGFRGDSFTATTTVTGGTFNDNVGEGIHLTDVAAVVLTGGVNALRNDPGVLVNGAASFSDTDGVYSNNDTHGIHLIDIAGSVTLTRTTANDNNADNADGLGDGVFVEDGGDVGGDAVGGSFTVNGGSFRDTSGAVNNSTRQQFGVNIDDPVAGNVVFQNSAGPVQSVNASGNILDGVRVFAAANVTFTNGTYNSNGGDGIDIDDVTNLISLTNVTANGNGLIDLAADNLQVDGIAAQTSVIITGGTFNNCAQDDGISLQNLAAATLTNVTATGNDDDGLQVTMTPLVSITGGTYSNNVGAASFGINLGGPTTLTATNVTADGNTLNGLDASPLTGLNTIAGGSFSSNGGDGIHVLGNGAAGTRLTMTATGVASNNGDDGLFATNFGGPVSITGWTFNDNGQVTGTGDGLQISNSGAVSLTTVTAMGNDPGANIDMVASFTATDSTFSLNDNHGILIGTVTGGVTLTRVTADNNDADDDVGSIGDGVHVSISIGGNLLVQGLTARDTDGPMGLAFHQRSGVFVIGTVVGSTTFQDSAGPVVSNTVTGNEFYGVVVFDGGTTATFTNGTYSNNGWDGIALASFSGTDTLTNVTATGNLNNGLGIYLGNPTLVMSGGSFSNNAWGIHVNSGGTTGTLTNVTATGNTFDGVLFESASGEAVGVNTISGGTFSNNGDDGLDISGNNVAGTQLVLTGAGAASNNGDDGLFAERFPTGVSITGWTFNDNGQTTATGDGVQITNSGAVTFTNVTAMGNDPGASISGVASFSDTAGNFSNNDMHGLLIEDVVGSVTLIRTTANNNDADNDGMGDGVHIQDGGDLGGVAVGDDLIVRGCTFRDLGGVNDHQERGLFATGNMANAIADDVTFNDSVGPVQSMNVSGNEADGVVILGGDVATFTNGSYSGNGSGAAHDGIDLSLFNTVTLSFVTASSNTGAGFRVTQTTTLNVNDFTGLSNGSGNGGVVGAPAPSPNVVTFNLTTSTGNVVDDITTGPGTVQHTRAGTILQPISYNQIVNLCIFLGDGDDSAVIGGGDYTPFFNFVFPGDTADFKIDGGAHNVGDALLFNATNGNDTIVIDFMALNAILINGNPVSNPIPLPGMTSLTNFESVGVNGLQGNDTFTVLNLPTAMQFTSIRLNGNEGDDIFNASTAPAQMGVTLVMNGNDGNDSMLGHLGNDTMSGGNDNDTLIGGPGNDTLTGDAGNDLINGGDGNDSLDGGLGNDTFAFAGASLDTDTLFEPPGCVETDTLDFSGLAGAVNINLASAALQNVSPGNLMLTLSSGTSIENVIGTPFADTVLGNDCNNLILGGNGADSLTGAIGNDTLDGGSGAASGNDTLDGGTGNDSLLGFDGNDSMIGGTGNDTMTGGLGNDTMDGGDNDDSMIGGDGNDSMAGGLGNDTMDGGNNNDTLDGGAGNDSILAGTGNDSIVGGAGNDTMDGSDGNDTYFFVGANLGSDTVLEPGSCQELDLLDFSGFNQGNGTGITLNLSITSLQVANAGLSLTLNNAEGIENVTGSAFADVLTGNNCTNNMLGGGGDDSLLGVAAADTIDGGAGNDTIVGGAGNDSLVGGSENDLFIWFNGDGSDTIEGGSETDEVEVNGAPTGEVFTLKADGARVDFDRTTVVAFNLDCGAVETFDINMNGGNDTLTLTTDVTANGVSTVDVDGGTEDDTYIVDFAGGNLMPATMLYNGGAGTDLLRLQGPNGTPFAKTVHVSTGPSSGTSKPDGQLITWSSTERVDQTKESTQIVYKASAGQDLISVLDGPVVNMVQTTQVLSTNGTFATFNFGNLPATAATLMTLQARGGADIVTANNPNPALGMDRMRLFGHGSAGDDGAIDRFFVTPSSVPYTVHGHNPPPNICPGDSLDTNLSGGALGQTLIPTGPGSGVYTYTNRAAITFTSIEDVSGRQIVVTATDFGTNQLVRVYDALTGAPLPGVIGAGFNPFSDLGLYRGGVRVAAGDVNGDCVPDIIAAAGPQAPSLVRVYDGLQARLGNQVLIGNFQAFEAGFTGGTYVAVADFNGDGRGDIVVGAGKPSSARLRVFNGATVGGAATLLAPEIQAFDASIHAGARVAAGDYNGDGQMDIAVGMGSGTTSRIRVINGGAIFDGFNPATDLLDDFLAFGANFKRGVFITMSDLDGDNDQEVIVGKSAEAILQNVDFGIDPTAPTPPEVRSFSYDGFNHGGVGRAPDFSVLPYDPSFNTGVRVGAWMDGAAGYFLTAPGPDRPGQIRQLTNLGATNTIFATEAFTQGYFVAGSKRNDGRIFV